MRVEPATQHSTRASFYDYISIRIEDEKVTRQIGSQPDSSQLAGSSVLCRPAHMTQVLLSGLRRADRVRATGNMGSDSHGITT